MLAAVAALLLIAAPQPAMADSVRTLNITATCSNGFQSQQISSLVNINYGAGWVAVATGPTGTPGGSTWSWITTIPTSASTLSIDAFCLAFTGDYYPAGYYLGYAVGLSPGASTVNTSWACTRHTVYPGPMVRICNNTSVTYS